MKRMTDYKVYLVIFLLAAFSGLMVFALFSTQREEEDLGQFYLDQAFAKTGANNVVSAIYLHYRAYDTLLEVLVFSAAVLGVSLFARWEKDDSGGVDRRSSVESSVIEGSGALLFSPVVLLGVYITFSAHLGPGGGFAGGVIGGTAVLLVSLAIGAREVGSRFNEERLKRFEYLIIFLLLSFVFFSLSDWGIALLEGMELSSLIAINAAIGLKVFIGTWAVLHFFIEHRGEV